jgi:hypothetical protein
LKERNQVLSRQLEEFGPQGRVNYLLNVLSARDTQTLDLVLVGRDLVKKYGVGGAEQLVLDTWSALTNHQPTTKAGDVVWLMAQPARVKDVAWLVQFRSEWLKP